MRTSKAGGSLQCPLDLRGTVIGDGTVDSRVGDGLRSHDFDYPTPGDRTIGLPISQELVLKVNLVLVGDDRGRKGGKSPLFGKGSRETVCRLTSRYSVSPFLETVHGGESRNQTTINRISSTLG